MQPVYGLGSLWVVYVNMESQFPYVQASAWLIFNVSIKPGFYGIICYKPPHDQYPG